jgi:hypothetical protein
VPNTGFNALWTADPFTGKSNAGLTKEKSSVNCFRLLPNIPAGNFFMTFHYADDVLRKSSGMDKPGFSAIIVLLILVIWLYSILMLRERRSGYIIGLLGSFMASFIAVGHLTGIAGDVFTARSLMPPGLSSSGRSWSRVMPS